MIRIVIKGWSDEQTWLGGCWSHFDYAQRLQPCTCLSNAARSSVADALVKREPCELDLINRERAEALIYALGTSGALFELKHQPPVKVISLDQHRKAAVAKTVTRVIASAR